ncbi:MAG: DUF4215 domain-containing protein [Deltaproteobacteria bacterium]|nr:DUF4215 domain-containing protein [Deltaproteobacteria bacterium]
MITSATSILSTSTFFLVRTASAACVAIVAMGCTPTSGPDALPQTSTDAIETHSSQRSAATQCGNGVVDVMEICDDGNLVPDDGCDSTCVPSGVSAMSRGLATSCMVTHSGHVYCWGLNGQGQLGHGHLNTIGDDETPVGIAMVDVGGLADDVQTNGRQSYALLRDGSVRAWGINDAFELGLMHAQTIGDDESPGSTELATIVELGGNATQIAVGGDFACARLDDGGVRCWGANDRGQLGYGHHDRIGDDETPQSAGDIALGGPAFDITAGQHHACAVLAEGEVRCWGANEFGQLGLSHTADVGDDEPLVTAGFVDVGGPVSRLVAGRSHTCALLESGAMRCWGDGQHGQLGTADIATIGDNEAPSAVGEIPLGDAVVDFAAGQDHTCAVLDGGQLRCWGDGRYGQLGRETIDNVGDDEAPDAVAAVALGSGVLASVFSGAGARSTCAVFEDDTMRCWGANDSGQLGLGHTMTLGDEPQ